MKGCVQGQYKTWTLDSGLVHGLDSGLNNGLDIWTRISIARGQRSRQSNQQQSFDVSSSSVHCQDDIRRGYLAQSMCFLKSRRVPVD